MGEPVLPYRGSRVSPEDVDQHRGRAIAGRLYGLCCGGFIAARLEFGYSGGTRRRSQDVADLRRSRDGVQVGSSCGVTAGPRRELPGLARDLLCSPVCIEGGDALQDRSRRSVGESPGGGECGSWAWVVGCFGLEYRQ